MRVHARRPIAAAVVTVVAATFPVFLVGAIGPQLRDDFGFGRSALGAAIGICQAAWAATAWSLGRRVIAHGPARAVRASVLLSSVALVGVAVVATGWLTLVLFLVCCGIANAIGQPATNALLAAEVAPERHGHAFGVKMAAVPLSSILVGVLIPLVAVPIGWRAAVGLGLVLPALALGLSARARSAPCRFSTSCPHRTPPGWPGPAGGGRRVGDRGHQLGTGVLRGCRRRLRARRHDGGSVPGVRRSRRRRRPTAGRTCGDRRAHTSIDVVMAMMLSGACGFVFIASSIPIVQLAGVVVVFGLGWGWVGLFQYLLVAVNPANPGSATGITDTGGYSAPRWPDRRRRDRRPSVVRRRVGDGRRGHLARRRVRVRRRSCRSTSRCAGRVRAGSATPARHVVAVHRQVEISSTASSTTSGGPAGSQRSTRRLQPRRVAQRGGGHASRRR